MSLFKKGDVIGAGWWPPSQVGVVLCRRGPWVMVKTWRGVIRMVETALYYVMMTPAGVVPCGNRRERRR